MEISTIIGIVVAIIICIVGLRMIFRKPDEATPSLETELHVNEDSNKPVIPRHVRNQLHTELSKSSAERIEPSLQIDAEDAKTEPHSDQVQVSSSLSSASQTSATQAALIQAAETADVFSAAASSSSSDLSELNDQQRVESKASIPNTSVHAETSKVQHSTDNDKLQVDSLDLSKRESDVSQPTEVVTAQTASQAPVSESSQSTTSVVEKAVEFSLNPNIQTAEIKDFDEESSILDVHLHEQQRFDDESELARAEHIISLNVYPNPRKALSGDKTLKVLLKYGLRFGEMNCFHRYEDPEKVSPLMFSVLRITEEGPAGFDLEALSVEQVKGLAFFLALPHQNVQKGYDSMVSIAGLIARETDGTVYDENNLEFTPQLKEHWRHKAIDYRAGQAL